jgi:hypothetical protein
VSSEPRVYVTVDRGTATTAVAILGRVANRWRLLGSGAAPAAVPPEAVAERIRDRLATTDPELAAHLGLVSAGSLASVPVLACATARPPEMAVMAATERVVAPLADAAATAGWRVRRLALDGADILEVASALVDPRVAALLAGASDPPGADERPLMPHLATILASATERRPSLVTVLAGGLAVPGGKLEAMFGSERPGSTVLAPAPSTGGGEPLRALLDSLRGGHDDGRRAIATATGTLAEAFERRVEVIEVGQSASLRASAPWTVGRRSIARSALVAAGALLPAPFTDANLDAVERWLTVPLDRLRLRDRLREMSIVPWGDVAGDGALLRLAAAKASVERLLDATPAISEMPAPDLLVAAGGAWSVLPGPAIALALADVVRRPGARALGLDHARLLGPLGQIADPDDRLRVVRDLRDELLVPLGSLLMPAGLRPGRSAGSLLVRRMDGDAPAMTLDLQPGGIELVDLPPAQRAAVELRLRDAVDVGVRTRHAVVEVTGGLAGLLVDLRDIPMHLPDRPERRREVLAEWQAALWPGMLG